METAFYFYTIVVMLVCVASGSVSLSAYFVSRRHSFLYAAAMLLFYFLDLALIFQYEYLGQNVEYSINQFYTIDHPQLKILLALGTLEPMWLILCDFVNERRRVLRLAPALAFIAASEIVVLCLPVDEFRQWLFYTLRQTFLLWCLAFGVYRYCTARNEVEKARLRRQGAAVPRHFSSVPVHSHRGCRHDPRLRFQLLRERRYAAPIYQRAELL